MIRPILALLVTVFVLPRHAAAQALIPQDPTGLRGLDHLRHLYYNENHLQILALYGGLDIWVFRNTAKLLEWSTSARDDFDGTTRG